MAGSSARVVCALVCCFVALAAGDAALATEGGGGAYANGAEGFMVGAAPPPGTYFVNYLAFYSANVFKDGAGRSLLPGFGVRVLAEVPRFLWVSKGRVLGGTWGIHLTPPLLDVELTTPAGRRSASGLGDVVVNPLLLGWHHGEFHTTVGLDFVLPTGDYGRDDPVNVGRNYVTMEPLLAFTLRTRRGFELSFKFMYDINSVNHATDYRSGDEFHFDWVAARHVGSWSYGLGGYYYRQVTSDEVGGATVAPDGFEGEVFALGPQFKFTRKSASFVLTYQDEMNARNRPEGSKVWLKFLTRF